VWAREDEAFIRAVHDNSAVESDFFEASKVDYIIEQVRSKACKDYVSKSFCFLNGDNVLPSKIITSKDYYAIKEVDRKLAYSVIKSSFLFCDIGGADGVDAIPFSHVTSFGVCLDIDIKKLKRGLKNARTCQVEHKLDFIRATAVNVPFRNGAFDLVTSFSVIDHLPCKKRAREAIMEFARICKPGGYVVVTIPNKLFVVGTFLMKIKALTEKSSFFEQRFTAKEMAKFFTSSGLVILRYDSKYPTIIGSTTLRWNIPRTLLNVPQNIVKPLFILFAKMFQFAETLPLKLLGARLGLLSQKSREQ
jgi:SAM-dependent methyltransferase